MDRPDVVTRVLIKEREQNDQRVREREIRRSYTFCFEDGGKVPKSRNAGGLYNLEKVRTNFYRDSQRTEEPGELQSMGLQRVRHG